MKTLTKPLRHYTSEPMTFDPARTYRQLGENGRMSSHTKPVGFWVSAVGEMDWPAWVHDEMEGPLWEGRCANAVTVHLADNARIEVIETLEEFDAFYNEYAVKTGMDEHNPELFSKCSGSWAIDWPGLSEIYQGILVPNYLWPRRFVAWYYGWDCASGCIWDLSAIERVEVFNGQVAEDAETASL